MDRLICRLLSYPCISEYKLPVCRRAPTRPNHPPPNPPVKPPGGGGGVAPHPNHECHELVILETFDSTKLIQTRISLPTKRNLVHSTVKALERFS